MAQYDLVQRVQINVVLHGVTHFWKCLALYQGLKYSGLQLITPSSNANGNIMQPMTSCSRFIVPINANDKLMGKFIKLLCRKKGLTKF